jgi:hypothetical protein
VQVQNSSQTTVAPPDSSSITTPWESPNWSAVVVTSDISTFGANSFRSIEAEYVVPVAPQPSGEVEGPFNINCPVTQSSSWVGIDGDEALSSDLLQAGTESDASCQSQAYYAWYQWLPQNPNEVQLGGLAVSPGDDMWVEVWNTSATQGYVYVFDYATGQAVSLSIAAQPGTRLIGNTAEWVVERPEASGSYATLANYISDYFSDCSAETNSNATYSPGSASTQLWTMCNSQGPCSSASIPISFPTVLGTSAIQFQYEATGIKKAIL